MEQETNLTNLKIQIIKNWNKDHGEVKSVEVDDKVIQFKATSYPEIHNEKELLKYIDSIATEEPIYSIKWNKKLDNMIKIGIIPKNLATLVENPYLSVSKKKESND